MDLPTDDGENVSGLNEKLAALLKPVTEGLFELADGQFAFEKTGLEKRITQLETHVSQQNDTLSRLTEEKICLEKTVSDLRTDSEATAAALAQRETDTLVLQGKWESADAVARDRAEQIGALRQQLEKARTDLIHFRDASAVQRRLEQEEIAREKQTLIADKKELKETIATLHSEINKLKIDISTQLQTLARLSTDLTNANKNTARAERANVEIEKKVESYREKNADLSDTLKALKQETKAMHSELTKTQTEFTQQDKTVKRLTRELDETRQREIRLQAQVDANEVLLKKLLRPKANKG